MKPIGIGTAAVALTVLWIGAASAQGASDMTFFITSAGPGNGADLGGIDGADRHCQMLAERAGAGGKTWRAYLSLSAMDGKPAVNARDRIGAGPWHNAKGVLVANNVDELHSEAMRHGKEVLIDENGNPINGRSDSPNQHDMLTGSQPDGTAYTDGEDHTCRNWTSSADGSGHAQLGHHDRMGLERPGMRPNSWNSAHGSIGCSQQNLVRTGGNGYFYCFAVGR